MPQGTNFFGGKIGICNVYLDGLFMGRTTGTVVVKPDIDVKDFMFAQTGTKPQDQAKTGQIWMVNFNLGESDQDRMKKLQIGLIGTKSGGLRQNLYNSCYDDAMVLKLVRLEPDLSETTDTDYILNFYRAYPKVTGQWEYGADKQQEISVECYCFFDTVKLGFGYYGSASSVGMANA